MSSTRFNSNVPSPFDRKRLAVVSLGTSDAAITRAYTDPKSVHASTLLRLQKAALELGLPVPGRSEKSP
jgi:hypothetical protein